MGKPTITDVARVAGVSKKTVSRTINRSPHLAPATRAKVEQAIAELGFVPDPQARALALGRTFLLALVDDGSQTEVTLAVQEGLHDALAGSEYALALARPEGGRAAHLATFVSRHKPAGLILVPPLCDDPDTIAKCRGLNVPFVRLGGCGDCGPAAPGEHLLPTYERVAIAQAVHALVRLGHTRIGFVAGPETSPQARMRELGYLDAMAEHGLDRGASLVASGDFSLSSGREAGAMLLEVSPRPTAIVAANDAMAAGVLQSAHERGIRVPDALAIAGCGDSPLAASLSPPIASIALPWQELARLAGQILTGGMPATPAPAGVPSRLVRLPLRWGG